MKISRLLICIIFIFILFNTEAQIFRTEVPRFKALAGASSALSGIWSIYGNQAGITEIQNKEIGLSFTNLYLLKELSTRTGIFVFPFDNNVFGFSFSQFGKSIYRSNSYGFTYARKLSPKLNFGAQFNIYSLFFFEDNKTEFTHGLQLGCQYGINQNLILGLHLVNPYKTFYKTYSGEYVLPSILRVGLSNKFSEFFKVVSEIESDFSKSYIFKTGIEYDILQKATLRGGFSNNPNAIYAGFGYNLKNISADIGLSWNQHLGNSPSISLLFGL